MKRLLAALLTVAMLLGSMGTVFAVVSNDTSNPNYKVAVSENFETDGNYILSYTDGYKNEKDTNSKNPDYYYTLSAADVFGMDNYCFKANKSTVEFGSCEDILITGNQTPDMYIEATIDVTLSNWMVTQAASNYQSLLKLVRTRTTEGDSDQKDALSIYLKGGSFWVEGDNAEGLLQTSGASRDKEQLNATYETGKTYNIRIVAQLTDKNKESLYAVKAIYINGVNALADNATVKYLYKHKTGIISGMQIGFANNNFYDNYAIYTYQSADGVSPVLNKGKLVSLIRKYDTTDTSAVYYSALQNAKAKYEDVSATQSVIDEAANALEKAATVIINEDFEDTTVLVTMYCSGADLKTSEFSLSDSTTFGTGKKMITFTRSAIDVPIPTPFSKTASGTPNTYVETVVDVKISTEASGNNFIKFVRSHEDTKDDYDIAYIEADKSTGKLTLFGQNTKGAGDSRESVELAPYVDGGIYRIRVVMRLTDNEGEAAQEISAVYINGTNTLSSPLYMHIKGDKYGSLKLYNANKHTYDNLAVYTYTGTSPMVNNDALAVAGRSAAANTYSAVLTKANKVCNNKTATQAEINAAAAEVNTASDYATSGQTAVTAYELGISSEITGDIALPATANISPYGEQDIWWSTSNADLISAAGKVIRPTVDTNVTLTAHFASPVYGDMGYTKEAAVTVKADSENTDKYTFMNVTHSDGKVSAVKLLSRDSALNDAEVIAAAYVGGVLYDVDYAPIAQTTADTSVTVTGLETTLPSDLANCTVKIYVWDFETLKPLMAVKGADLVSGSAKIHIAGDSTAHTYVNDPNNDSDVYDLGQRGWGQIIGSKLDTVTVNNQAMGGRSADWFYTENYYKTGIKGAWRAGDYLFVQFGHNDLKENDYIVDIAKYKHYMRAYIDEARAAGVTPVIITSIPRYSWEDSSIKEEEQEMIQYVNAAKAVATEKDVACLDMFGEMVTKLETMGKDAAAKYYMGYTNPSGNDWTHFNEAGAEFFTGEIVRLLGECAHPSVQGLKACIK